MLKSLEELKYGLGNFFDDGIAERIQAEIDEKYISRDDLLGAGEYVAALAKAGVSIEEIAKMTDVLVAYGSLDAYIDKWCFRKPLFEDGEPADFGSEYLGGTKSREIDYITYYRKGKMKIGAVDETWHYLVPGERLKRQPEPDTQEKINSDYAKLTSDSINYSINAGLYERREAEAFVAELDSIRARQRKLDGVE